LATALTSRGRAQLGEYRRKRRFDVTAEPAGKVPTSNRARTARLEFVVQKHRATALHYDFRLEWRGVMRSWAVPKGPSLDPSVKRMAMQVEDHPLAYNRFEGIIPAGEYGGGTVMIWDRGTWTPESADVDAALESGELKLTLFGQKLHGSWVLVRLRARPGDKRVAWLFIKHRDEWAASTDVTETEPRSVESKRLLVEIARDEGGDMKRAADGDPPALLRRILEDPTLVTAAPRRGRKNAAGAASRCRRKEPRGA
jgi:bifunctional non-homologous end joining protein LigD